MKGTKIQKVINESPASTYVLEDEWFDKFYLETREEFLAWARKRSKLSENDLLDIYQQSMIVLYEKHISDSNLQLSSSLKTYLFGIAQNIMLKQHRKERVVQRHADRLKEHWLFQGNLDYEIESRLSKVMDALQNLGENCRKIISLFYLSSMTLQEISDELNYGSSDVVKTQKSRCVKKLKKGIND